VSDFRFEAIGIVFPFVLIFDSRLEAIESFFDFALIFDTQSQLSRFFVLFVSIFHFEDVLHRIEKNERLYMTLKRKPAPNEQLSEEDFIKKVLPHQFDDERINKLKYGKPKEWIPYSQEVLNKMEEEKQLLEKEAKENEIKKKK
jgi:hypothetical protein